MQRGSECTGGEVQIAGLPESAGDLGLVVEVGHLELSIEGDGLRERVDALGEALAVADACIGLIEGICGAPDTSQTPPPHARVKMDGTLYR